MTKQINKYQNQTNEKQTTYNEFYKDIIKMMKGVIELSKIVKQYNYNEKVLPK